MSNITVGGIQSKLDVFVGKQSLSAPARNSEALYHYSRECWRQNVFQCGNIKEHICYTLYGHGCDRCITLDKKKIVADGYEPGSL